MDAIHNTPLDLVAKEINARFAKAAEIELKAKDHRIAAGLRLVEARRRVDAGESSLGWEHWCAENIDRSQRDIRRCMKLAGAPDSEAALATERAATAERVAAIRARQGDVHPSCTSALPEPAQQDDLPRQTPSQSALAQEIEPVPGEHPLVTLQKNAHRPLEEASDECRKLYDEVIDGPRSNEWRALPSEAHIWKERVETGKFCLDALYLDAEDIWNAKYDYDEPEPEGDGKDPNVKAAIEGYRAWFKKLNPIQKAEFLDQLRMVKRTTPGNRFKEWSYCVDRLRELQGEFEELIDNIDENPDFLDPTGDKRERYARYVDIDLTELEVRLER